MDKREPYVLASFEHRQMAAVCSICRKDAYIRALTWIDEENIRAGIRAGLKPYDAIEATITKMIAQQKDPAAVPFAADHLCSFCLPNALRVFMMQRGCTPGAEIERICGQFFMTDIYYIYIFDQNVQYGMMSTGIAVSAYETIPAFLGATAEIMEGNEE